MKVPAYFEQEVKWDSLFTKTVGGKTREVLTMPNKDNVQRWADKINCEMSPENLHCDGEISPAQARAKAKVLQAAMKHLEKIAGRSLADF